MQKRRSRRTRGDSVGLVPTGSTLLNLACSNTTQGAFKPGTLNNIVGDSSAGKTLLALTILAEMSLRPEFKDYSFIYDDIERRLFFNIERLFGKKVAGRIQGPSGPIAESASTTIESFYYNMDDFLKKEKPFIYILDSMDGLDDEAAQKKFQESKEAFQKDKTAKGTYAMDKARVNSKNLRWLAQSLRDTKSIVIIISQTRSNISPGFAQKTRAGGNALEFYACHIMWLAKMGKIKKTINGKQRTIGVDVRSRVSKNSLTGLQIEVDFPLYYNYGLDDISSMIDFLISEKCLKSSGGKVTWKGEQITKKALIKHFENKGTKGLENKCQEVWTDIVNKLFPDRKPKYE